ncbi:hypothetical protein LCGC14_0346540 [marine sediment metagenome]|uniref:Uncharacterized protein n=1 Tax=marine sediment metagenome TaxID=412755 RepID=A0A0F9TVA0_9ZZZZ
MPPIPKFRAKITPQPVGKAPLPVGAADIGAGAIGQGLQAIGRGVSDIGQALLKVELDKQKIRDDASLASANGDYDKFVADRIDEARRTTFTSIEQFPEFRKQTEADLDTQVGLSISKMSPNAGQLFDNFSKTNKQTTLRQIEGIVWRKEVEFGQADTMRQYSNKFQVLAGAGVPLEEILKDPTLSIIEEGMAPYWSPGEMARARDRILIDSLVNVGRYEDAKNLTNSTEAFTPTEKQARLSNINTIERARVNQRDVNSVNAANAAVETSYSQIVQLGSEADIEQFARLILSDPTISNEDAIKAVDKIKTFYTTWNSAIKEPDGEDIVTSDSTRIKALRVINAVKTGSMTVDRGLEVYQVISKIEGVNGTDGKGFINDIFAAGETAKRVELVRQNEILGEREKQLRDAIEKQPNFFGDDVAAEILKDFANTAVIELNDAFREGEFDKKELDAQVDNLIRRYTLSEVQQLNAASARSLRLAKTLKEQQESITKLMTSLREQGKTAEAQRIMDEAIELGIFTKEGETIKKGTGKKKNIGIEVIKRMLDSIIR